MDVRALFAAQKYEATRPATQPDPMNTGGNSGDFATAARDFTETLQSSETASVNAMTSGADPHALVHALAQTELAVETAVTVRDKVVEAYQEILRMPV